MKKHYPHKEVHGTRTHRARQARTGEHCPFNGWWAPAGREEDRRYVMQGNILPAHDGGTVVWTLVAAGSGSRHPKYVLPPAGVFIDTF